MNNKAFTLVELLVTMVILSIIMGMSWPMVTRMQEENHKRKYKSYADSLISGAKLYIDSYEEDLFYYEEDLTEESAKKGQCAIISYRDLKEHDLGKDINISNTSCASQNTFVIAIRKNGNYKYYAFLGCGNSDDVDSLNGLLDSSKINYIYPERDTPYVASKSTEPYLSLGCEEPVLK